VSLDESNKILNRLGDIINDWRENTLSLEQIGAIDAAGAMESLKVPYTYCWSPSLVPKPDDWPSHIGKL